MAQYICTWPGRGQPITSVPANFADDTQTRAEEALAVMSEVLHDVGGGMDEATPRAVAAVLEAVDEAAGDLGSGDPLNFAFNVLLNALWSVMETIRFEDPDAFAKVRDFAIATLQDDGADGRGPSHGAARTARRAA